MSRRQSSHSPNTVKRDALARDVFRLLNHRALAEGDAVKRSEALGRNIQLNSVYNVLTSPEKRAMMNDPLVQLTKQWTGLFRRPHAIRSDSATDSTNTTLVTEVNSILSQPTTKHIVPQFTLLINIFYKYYDRITSPETALFVTNTIMSKITNQNIEIMLKLFNILFNNEYTGGNAVTLMSQIICLKARQDDSREVLTRLTNFMVSKISKSLRYFVIDINRVFKMGNYNTGRHNTGFHGTGDMELSMNWLEGDFPELYNKLRFA